MKFSLPLQTEIFDEVCNQNNLSVHYIHVYERLAQLDAKTLRSINKTKLLEFFKISRQTLTNHINCYIDKNLLLDTSIGLIVALPTYSGFFGKCYCIHENFYRFSITLPNANTNFLVDLYIDQMPINIQNKIKEENCYYLEANLNPNDDYWAKTASGEIYLQSPFIAMRCKDCYQLEDIGYTYKDNKFFKLGALS